MGQNDNWAKDIWAKDIWARMDIWARDIWAHGHLGQKDIWAIDIWAHGHLGQNEARLLIRRMLHCVDKVIWFSMSGQYCINRYNGGNSCLESLFGRIDQYVRILI